MKTQFNFKSQHTGYDGTSETCEITNDNVNCQDITESFILFMLGSGFTREAVLNSMETVLYENGKFE